MKGIVLAGGSGTRLWPSTSAISKQLLPIFDKPMIYYPIATLMSAGIKEILIIAAPDQIHLFEKLLGNGSRYGISFEFKVQKAPNGLAEALILGEHFLSGNKSSLILGDNFFHGSGLGRDLNKYLNLHGAQIFAQHVVNPQEYGNVILDRLGNVLEIEEKPANPKSNLAVTGLYFYDESASDRAKSLTPSDRNELEITSLNQSYLDDSLLNLMILPRGTTWMDTGSHRNLSDASNYVRVIEDRQGLKIACLEEISFINGWLTADQIFETIEQNSSSNEYVSYLHQRIMDLGELRTI
jgi:glucose-1-phosphate thymidylyltransferase